MRPSMLAGALLLLSVPSASAQTLTPGTRVRVTTETASVVARRVVPSSPDSLRLALPTGDEVTLAWADVQRVEQSLGRRSHVGRGALIGAGAMTALLVGSIALDDELRDDEWARFFLILTVPPAAALGAGVGALIGLAWRTERWVDLPVRLAPARAGLGLGVITPL